MKPNFNIIKTGKCHRVIQVMNDYLVQQTELWGVEDLQTLALYKGLSAEAKALDHMNRCEGNWSVL